MVSQKNFPQLIASLLRVDLKRENDFWEEAGPNVVQLMRFSREDLYEMALSRFVYGRYTMNKKKLAAALSH